MRSKNFRLAWIATIAILTAGPHIIAAEMKTFDIRHFGATGDGRTLDTAAVNRAIDACAAAGGGSVVFPPGKYLSGTVRLKSGVELRLEAGATLVGSPNLKDYEHFTPPATMVESKWPLWHRALILGDGATNLRISGKGTIDGAKVFDPHGEERMRGPHAVLLGNCRDVIIRDVSIKDAANYGILFERTDRVEIRNVKVTGGWDGVHFRGSPQQPCRDVTIADCQFFTGDDCIAGRYWEGVRITGCTLNSSCNCVRLIGPATHLAIERCRMYGPGEYPHRSSKSNRRNCLAGLNLQPGSWDGTQGRLDDVTLQDLTMENVSTAFHFVLKPGNTAGRILASRVKATGVYDAASSVESWAEAPFEDVTFRDVSIEFAGGGKREVPPPVVRAPGNDARPLPAWGFYFRNAKNLTLERVRLSCLKDDPRPVLMADRVERLVLTDVALPRLPGAEEPLVLKDVKHLQRHGQDGTGFAGAYAPSKIWQPPKDPLALEKLKKFQDLKFGFFCCWGTQTQWETIDQSWSLCPERYEWNKRPGIHAKDDTLTYKKAYEGLIRTFNPVKFNPEQVAEIAEAAGTRYLVFCTKHHDGFCFWDTKTTDYKITSKDCPYHVNPSANVTKRLFDAFRKRGFWIGAYFSKADWNVPYYWSPQFGPPTSRNPNYSPRQHPEVWKQFKDFTWSQIRELMSDYGPVDILWLDGGQVQPGTGQDLDMPGLARMARNLQPGLLVVDRTAGGGCEDYLTPEGTHAMPKQYMPEAWEACMTLGDWWGWSKGSAYHRSGSVIRYLVRAVARNGNLLLDVGPDAHGEMDPQAVKVLREVGAWLKVNGEAIYGTRPVKPYELGNVFFTGKADGTVYAIALSSSDGEPMPKRVILPASLTVKVKRITLIGGDGTALPTKPGQKADTTEVDFPSPGTLRTPIADAWVLKLVK